MPAARGATSTGGTELIMTTTPATEAEADGDAAAPPPKPRLSRKVMLMALAGALVPLGGVGGYIFMRAEPAAAPAEAEAEVVDAFVDVPPMIVNLRVPGGQSRMLKVHVVLVPAKAEDAPQLTARLPLVVDAFQPFLRELRPDDLAGSAAVFRIKEELLRRAQEAVGRGKVGDVLVQELIQQ